MQKPMMLDVSEIPDEIKEAFSPREFAFLTLTFNDKEFAETALRKIVEQGISGAVQSLAEKVEVRREVAAFAILIAVESLLESPSALESKAVSDLVNKVNVVANRIVVQVSGKKVVQV